MTTGPKPQRPEWVDDDLLTDAIKRIEGEIADAVDAKIEAEAERREAIFEERVRTAAATYLTDLHCTQWGRAFDIIRPEGKANAVEFLVEALRGVGDRLTLADFEDEDDDDADASEPTS